MHPDTDIWLGAWQLDDMDEPEVWYPGESVPQRIIDHVTSGGEIRAHNAAFERIMWNYVAGPRYGWPEVKLEQFVCSAAEAAAMSLPRSLGQLAEVLGIAVQKDKEGYNLMMRMCRPRKVNSDGSLTWWDVPDRIQRLADYCKTDVRTERAAAKCLRRLTPKEREIYILDQRMNDEGIQLDRDLIAAAKEVAGIGIERANARLREISGGAISSVTKVAEIRAWLETEGVVTASVDKATVRALLDEDISKKAREVLELRATAGRSSIAKLESMEVCACDDGRVRGMLLYHGAGTGRWSGRLVQPQNFPRGDVDNIEQYIPLVMQRQYDIIEMMAPPVSVISSMLRSMLTAKPGHELLAADFSAIEARVVNWLAGQDDILQLFAEGKDVYKYNAARLYRIPLEEVQKFPHRQTGKFQELGCGFGMGAKKAVSAAKAVYGLEINDDQAKEIVDSYRDTHRDVVQYWYDCNDAVIEAVSNPGQVCRVGLRNTIVQMVKAGAYLFIVLPSGRPLCYPAPKVVMAPTPWGEVRPAVEFSGVNSYTRQWERQRLYGGLIVENIVQAVARDLMAEGMLRLNAAGYTPILSVHDEVVAEVPEGFGDVKEFEKILSTLPAWAEGCPVAAEGWRGFRYRK